MQLTMDDLNTIQDVVYDFTGLQKPIMARLTYKKLTSLISEKLHSLGIEHDSVEANKKGLTDYSSKFIDSDKRHLVALECLTDLGMATAKHYFNI